MGDANPIRVMIVDDHVVVRSGLMAFLAEYDDLDMMAEAGNGTEALVLCHQSRPDVVLIDLVMPGMNGIETTRALNSEFPQVQVIGLTSFPEAEMVDDVLSAGAVSCLLKNVAADELAATIRAASFVSNGSSSTDAVEITTNQR